MRLTRRKHQTLTTVAAAIVLVAASPLAGGSAPVATLAPTGSLDSGTGVPVSDRALHVPTVSVGQARLRDTKGTPTLPPSAIAHLDIPATALLAYRSAATVMGEVDASCGLSWTLLAAIGRIESNHGRYAGAQLRVDGTSSRKIRGVALDGSGPLAKIRDTDAGQLDGDAVWDRAVGPMQFLPSTWSVVGVDADGDGVRSPDDIDDAALAAAVFLCAAPGHLDTASGRRAAVFRYNPSRSYVASVVALERAYRTGHFDTTGEPTPIDPFEVIRVVRAGGQPAGVRAGSGQPGGDQAIEAGAQPGHHPSANPPATHAPTGSPGPDTTGTPVPMATPTPEPTDPGPTNPIPRDPGPTGPPHPTEPPSPTPDPPPTPDPVELTGVLTSCGEGAWCLGETSLDVGDADVLAATAGSDFDADGVVESNSHELTGLTGKEVTILVVPDTAPAVVVAVNGADYLR